MTSLKSGAGNLASGGTLLVLDDDPLTGQTIRNIAEFVNFSVEVSATPEEFFRKLDAAEPDFIALDLIMPGMDGIEIMAALAKRRCRSRIIITSGVGSRVLDAARRSAMEHGLNITGVLAKPFSPSTLRSLLDKPAGEQEKEKPSTSQPAEHPGVEINAAELERAIEAGEFFVWYQPKIACQTGVLAGFEALARWRHPELGMIPPDRFIPLAESSGLIDRLTDVILSQALHWFSEFCSSPQELEGASGQNSSQFMLSINLSAGSLGNLALFDRLNNLCRQLKVDPRLLIFELTETSAMEDPVGSLDLLTRLRMRGFRLSIDDFGTGFSSMLQLVRLPFSEVKVDKSFIASASHSEESRTVIQSIVELGHSLNLKVTAEGIEDEETLAYLRNIGCDFAQGYLIARPMPGENVAEWMAEREPESEKRRLAVLHGLKLLDTSPDECLERLRLLVRQIFDIPFVSVSLVDEDRVWLKSRTPGAPQEIPRNQSFCTYAIESDQVMVVADTFQDIRFASNPVVKAGGLRFYAGCPLHAGDGSRIGALTLVDLRPREFSRPERAALRELSLIAEKMLYRRPAKANHEFSGFLSQPEFESHANHFLSACQHLDLHCKLLLIRLEPVFSDTEDPETENEETGIRHPLEPLASIVSEAMPEHALLGRFGEDKLIVLTLEMETSMPTLLRAQLTGSAEASCQHDVSGQSRSRHRISTVTADPRLRENLQSLLARAELAIDKKTGVGKGGNLS